MSDTPAEVAWLTVFWYDVARRQADPVHWYATIYHNGKKIEIGHPLTQAEAERMNISEEVRFYREGTMTPQFETEEEARAAAVARWKDFCPGALRLVEGKTLTSRFTGLEALGTLLDTRTT